MRVRAVEMGQSIGRPADPAETVGDLLVHFFTIYMEIKQFLFQARHLHLPFEP